MNSFRASMLTGKGRLEDQPLLTPKTPGGPSSDSLTGITVAREATRTADHRDDDRHRLAAEEADVLFRGEQHRVELINLSGGGAMVRAGFSPLIWERVELTLGEHGAIECAVRWIRDDRIGLEFAHETQIHGDTFVRDAMLLEVIRRSFPDLESSAPASEPEALALDPAEIVANARRGEPRHPLIWSGTVHFSHDSQPVRLRNISPHGALIESPLAYPIGAELYLDLEEAGSLFATVSWSRGDQVGLSFAQIFDIGLLAKTRPAVAPNRWSPPQYMREDRAEGSPWSEQWGRLSVEELKTSLEGYLKH